MLSLLLCIGIVGYFSVPSVANYVIHAHGGNGFIQKVTSVSTSVASSVAGNAVSGAAAMGERGEQARSNMLNAPKNFWEGYHSAGDNYQKDKLSGK